MRKFTFRIGGIHPAEEKLTAAMPITALPESDTLVLSLTESIGKPSRPIVKPGQKVRRYEKIAEADGFVSAPLHSPVCGTVQKIERVRTPQGYWTDAIIIQRDPEAVVEEPVERTAEEIEALTPKEIIDIIGEAGVVGLGGATFPTKVKLLPPEGSKPDVVLINGAECEPYLTCDDRLMQEQSLPIALGAQLLMKAAGVDRCIIGIEDNKPEAIEAMRKAVKDIPGMSVEVLKKKYPQGGEKQLIAALLKRQVPDGALPVSVGAIVDNVATAYAVYDAVWRRHPLVERVVTVTGSSLREGGNFLVPLGTPLPALLEAAGGMPEDTGKLVAGGPMMGRAVSDVNTNTTKGFSGLLVLPEKMSHRKPEQPCIRCGRCVHACPMGLEPYLMVQLARHGRWEDVGKEHVMSCIECGSCSYVCPSSKPLLDFIRYGKQEVRKLKK